MLFLKDEIELIYIEVGLLGLVCILYSALDLLGVEGRRDIAKWLCLVFGWGFIVLFGTFGVGFRVCCEFRH